MSISCEKRSDGLQNDIDFGELVRVTQQLIQIPSMNPPGLECKVGKFVKKYMESHGIQTEIQKVMPGRYNVIARLKGTGESKALLFSSHMDVVPVSTYEAKRWKFDPLSGSVSDGYIYGRGAADAKGGLAAVMVAMSTLAASKQKPKGDILLAATVDEENLMMGAKKLVESTYLQGVDRVICCEPTNLELQICSKGRMWAEVNVFGQTAHASVKGAGSNAIYRALRLMNEMENHSFSNHKHDCLGETFWQTTMIQAGGPRGIVPDSCTLNVDVRLVPGQTHNDIWEEMEAIFAEIRKDIPDFQAEINEIERREPWVISRTDRIVRTAAEACLQVGVPVVYSGYIATAECTIYQRTGIKGVIFGPGKLQDNAYKENERVSMSELLNAAKVYKATMLNWKN